MDSFEALMIIVVIISIPIYFIPTIIAVVRKCYKRCAIILINIFLGFTIIGWFGSLIWAIIDKTDSDVEKKYQEDLLHYNMLMQQQEFTRQQIISQQIFFCQGNSEQLYNAALRYETGNGTQIDHNIAFHLMAEAAKLGSSQANYKLGTYYEYGIGVPQNIELSKVYYDKSTNIQQS